MSAVVPLRPHAIPAWLRLQEALDNAGPTACRDGLAWISDNPDERRQAVLRCAGCPAIRACGEYATIARERAGVWGGVDRTPDKGRPPQSLPLFETGADETETA